MVKNTVGVLCGSFSLFVLVYKPSFPGIQDSKLQVLHVPEHFHSQLMFENVLGCCFNVANLIVKIKSKTTVRPEKGTI